MQGRRRHTPRQAALAVILLCAGCDSSLERLYSSRLPVDTPIEWWHQLEGGVIGDERPAPPGVGQPYPTLSEIPAKPVPTDAATRAALSSRLATQRNQMQRADAQDPIPNIHAAPAGAAAATSSAAPPAPAAPPPMARIDAATAPPAPTPPAPPPAAIAPAAIQQAAGNPARPAPAQPGDQPLVSGPAPALPTAAPPLPNLPGIPAESLAPAPRAQQQAVLAFLPGSAVLRPESDTALRSLANRRAGGPVAILGGGDAASAAPEAQAAALPLAWRRARAIQAVLADAGVPAAAMRVDAAALDRGGVARLVN